MAATPPPNPPGPVPSQPRRSSMVLGGLLVLIGAALLIGQVVRIDVGHAGWPLLVIAPGVVILFLALTAKGALGEGLAILGSILTVTGLILLYQDATDHFESWAYAWTLIFPGAVGLGMVLYGLVAGRPGNLRAGARLIAISVVLFLLGVAFFEGVIGLGGYQFGRASGTAAGALIVAMGAALLILNLASGRRHPR